MTNNITENTSAMIFAISNEVTRARGLFPSNNLLMVALAEEFGEVAKALLDEPWIDVQKEAIQLAAMAIRLATEGDCTVSELRKSKKLDYINE